MLEVVVEWIVAALFALWALVFLGYWLWRLSR